MVARCWPSGDVIEILDGSKYHGKYAEPYKKTKEGWWLVFLSPGGKDLYLLMDKEYHRCCISWR